MLRDRAATKQRKSKLSQGFLAAFFMSLSLATGAQTEANYQASLKTISGEIKALSRNLNANRSLLENEQTELLKSEQEFYVIQKKLAEATNGLKQSREELQRLRKQQAELETQKKRNGEVLGALLKSQFKTGSENHLKQILNQENPYALGRLNNYRSYFSTAVKGRFKLIESQLAEINSLKVEQQQAASKYQSLQQEQEFLERSNRSQSKQRQELIARLQTKVSDTQSRLTKLRADRSRLNELLEKLAEQRAEMERIEKERIEAERRAAERAKAEGKTVRKVVRKPIRGGFTKQRGRLQCPLDQQPVTEFGQRIVSSGMRSEGIVYKTEASVDVRSLFRGQVLFADFLKGFGLLLIIDHGEDHISLYGHNEVLYKKVGDSVDTNEVVSKTGKTGGLKSPGLYFEIRKNTTPIDPSRWCQ